MVVLYHLHPSSILTALPIVRNGWLFVDFFFVLSGFVIAANYATRLAAGFSAMRFMGLRLGRVYPLHLFLILLFALVQILAAGQPFQGEFSLRDLWLNVLLLQSFGLSDHLSWNGPAWSIAAEVWTYLVFAIVARSVGRFMVPAFAVLGLLALAIMMTYSTVALDATYQLGFVRCLLGFSLGVLVNSARQHLHLSGSTLLEVAAVLAVVAFASVAEGNGTYAAPFLFAFAVFVFAGEGGGVSRTLRLPTFLWLGTLSYGIYMFQIFALARFFDAIAVLEMRTGWKLLVPGEATLRVGAGSPIDRLLTEVLTLLALLFVILFAWIGWRLVEWPGRNWSRRLLGRRGGVSAAPAPAP